MVLNDVTPSSVPCHEEDPVSLDQRMLNAILGYSAFLSTGAPEMLQYTSPGLQQAAVVLKAMDDSAAMGSCDFATLESELLTEFSTLPKLKDSQRFSPCSEMSFHDFVPLCLEQFTAARGDYVSERTLHSGLMLWMKYLLVSAENRRTQVGMSPTSDTWTTLTKFQSQADYSLCEVVDQCIAVALIFFDGKELATTARQESYRQHVLETLQYDIIEQSPMDFIGPLECLCDDPQIYQFVEEICAVLRRLVTHPVCLGCGSVARLAATCIVVALFQQQDVHARLHIGEWIEQHWAANDTSFLGKVIQLISEHKL